MAKYAHLITKWIIVVLLIIFTIAVVSKFQDKSWHDIHDNNIQTGHMEISEEHCRMMPTMEGCEIYNFWTGNSGTMDHGSMITGIESYLFEMIPHHQEAVDSSTMLINKTLFLWDQLDQLQTIASNIVSGQALEINQLTTWIADHYSGSTYTPHYMNMMRNADTITDVPTLKKIYAEDMILHHQGAIDMSNKLLELMTEEDKVIRVTEEGMKFRNDIKAFAQNVIDAQTKEIAELTQILESYTSVSTN